MTEADADGAAARCETRIETRIIESLARVSQDYDAVFCDLWGCYHNGVQPYAAAVAALIAYRRGGGVVVLLTNAPRPSAAVRRQLAGMGAPTESFDAVVSSGDATRAALQSGAFGKRFHIVGPPRDEEIWRGTDIEPAPLETAQAILCTGLFDDERETPDDYARLVADGVARGLTMLCANPDIIVDRGHRRLYCAGAIAQAYAAAGGEVRYFGKPHAPIYALALATARSARPDLSPARVLAIGDGADTDVLGAQQAGYDCLFVSGGLAAAEVGETPEAPDPDRLRRWLAERGRAPRYAIGLLA